MLEALDRDNLFLVPLDDRRQWYRYHHLFADVLQARLLDEQPERVGELHRLASEWYAQHGDRAEAIRHAMAGGDFGRAAGLMELEIPALRRDRREATLRGWLESLPAEVLRVRPVLVQQPGRGADVDRHVRGGRGAARTTPSAGWTPPRAGGGAATGMVVVDQDEFLRLPADIAVHRAGLALVRGDIDGTVEYARRALDVALEDDHLARGAALALRGLAAWSTGDLEVADASYTDCLVEFEQIDHVSDVLGCSIALADMQVAQGRLRAAMRTYEQALELASRHGSRVLRGTVDMYVGRAALHRELGDLAAARRDLARSRELGEHAGLPQNAYRWRVVMAQVCEAEGDLEAALDLLDEAERLYEGDFSPNVRPVPAVRARVWIRHGPGGRRAGLGQPAGPVRGRRPQLPARVRARHPGPGTGGRPRPGGDAGASTRRSSSWGACCARRRTGTGAGSVIDIRVAEALAHQRRGDLPARWPPWRRPWAWRSRRATSARSSTRVHRWRTCWPRPPTAGTPRRTSAGSGPRCGVTPERYRPRTARPRRWSSR